MASCVMSRRRALRLWSMHGWSWLPAVPCRGPVSVLLRYLAGVAGVSLRRCHQRLGQVGEKVVGVFNANRKPDRCITDADACAQLGGYARVRRAAGMAGERLCSSQADGELKDLQSIEAGERLREPTFDIEGEG